MSCIVEEIAKRSANTGVVKYSPMLIAARLAYIMYAMVKRINTEREFDFHQSGHLL